MKKLKIFALVFAIIIAFSGCASANTSFDLGKDFYDSGIAEEGMPFEPEAPMEMPETEAVTEDSIFDGAASANSSGNQYSGNRKLIRNFTLDVEALEFESFVSNLKAEVNSVGGYIESSNISGNSYNYTSNRVAGFTCRIPSEKVDEFINTVGGLGNVTYSYEDTTDVTLTYVDTEARIKSLQTEYDRLLELLAEAESIDSIIVLEQRITEVRYQLESYKSQLRTYDNLVDYSTVNISIYEVKRITAPEQETVWERISSDFSDNIYDIWVGAEDFFVWFVANIPYFVIWAIIIAIIAFVLSLCFRNNKKWQERKAAKKARKEYKKAQKLAENKPVESDSEEK